MRKLSFKNKGENLANLAKLITKAKILPLIMIKDISNENKNYENIRKLGKNVIIRSSSNNEDTNNNSNAGAFLSIANVDTRSKDSTLKALNDVYNSMGNKNTENNYILVQPMLENIAICGVAFSVNKDNLAPYFCISYDKSGESDSVTSGRKSDLVNLICYRKYRPKDSNISKLIDATLEIEKIFDNNFLDIEFAFDKNGILYILQVRPIVIFNKQNLFNELPISSMERLKNRIDILTQKHPYILGDRAIFGVMPDWNPAEIIGLKPKRLATSLYKELVTDNIWAYQRDNYGYMNLRSHPLMHSFLGIPYIDVRLSFNSFIPKTLNKNIANKLVNYYLTRLANKPYLHDKVEFEIVFSCYDLNLVNKLAKLKEFGFNQNELKRVEFSLLDLTNNILDSKNGLYLKDLNKIDFLEHRYNKIMESNLQIVDKIYWLIEDCKRFGTLPFAGIARAAFVAMQILNSLVEIGFFSKNEKERFLSSLKTISKDLSHDVYKLQQNKITKDKFLSKYGHLRAGSYNILSPSYNEAFNEYFSNKYKIKEHEKEKPFKLEIERERELDILLSQNGLYLNAKELFNFIKIVIEGRELAKFKFSKFLSQIIDLIAVLGGNLDIDKENLAHLDIKNILSLQSSLYKDDAKERFLDEIKRHKKEYLLTTAIKLPPLIIQGYDIFYFQSSKVEPNFITQKIITAQTATQNNKDLKNKIVLIDSADPGYDYLLTKNIAGLITCYGGANSHMAIRCSELLLPAVIGVGEEKFNIYRNAEKLTIDALNQQIFIL